MPKLLCCLVFAGAVAVASAATAGELTVKMAGGLVTIIAKDVPVRQILAEWARVGNTRIVNGEKMAGGPLTLELVDMPEKEALDILLRSAAGYMTAPRAADATGASVYDRVIILATSRAPITTVSSPPQPFGRPAAAQPLPPQPPPDDANEPGEQGPVPPPGMANPGMPFPGPTPAANQPFQPVGPDGMPVNPVNQVPMTAPRPGMLPQPAPNPNPNNPYVPIVPTGRPVPGPGGRGGQAP
jgi:hypothetical protein